MGECYTLTSTLALALAHLWHVPVPFRCLSIRIAPASVLTLGYDPSPILRHAVVVIWTV